MAVVCHWLIDHQSEEEEEVVGGGTNAACFSSSGLDVAL